MRASASARTFTIPQKSLVLKKMIETRLPTTTAPTVWNAKSSILASLSKLLYAVNREYKIRGRKRRTYWGTLLASSAGAASTTSFAASVTSWASWACEAGIRVVGEE